MRWPCPSHFVLCFGDTALSKKLKKELKRNLKADEDYAKIYAICIYFLIVDNLDKFDILVICGDEDFIRVRKYLEVLFMKIKKYKDKKVISIGELRKVTGKNKLKSYADNSARSYRRRALKSLVRQQEGNEISPIRIGYNMIKIKWQELDKNQM